ncbi:MAG: YigZ family protein [Bacteroidales bacterium]|nr:YigZ family protein [Bacteroidales bacterium]MBQ2103953.1 YigZ family protein [Bacteroidales bacterium]MBQ2501039.1 YigZ family protein [Bacteroidales bacterium]MBQ3983842.1 YigZ family protein [Bacteroidales bacterium]MBQ4169403.1 YigZ family protein [Bacteroidales bacterium]
MPPIKDTYNSIGSPSRGLYKDQGSRFISFAYPVETEAQVKELVDSLKKEYHDARHHCFAYRLGLDGSRYRMNDDGEPSSTAGRPILSQIDSAGLSDVLVVVVRYFGGIKLGVPGLIKAYKTAAQDALAQAAKVEKTAAVSYHIEFDYMNMDSVMRTLKDMDIPQSGQNFGQLCSMDIRVRLSQQEELTKRLVKYLSLIIQNV